MATSKPRITVTLSPRQHEVLQAFSKFSGKTMSSTIGEFLEASMPTLERMAATFQRIHEMQEKERDRIASQLDDAQSVLEPLIMQSLDQFDLFLGQVEQAVGGVSASGEGAAQPVSTPLTNRGVTPTHEKARKTKSRAVSKPVRHSKNSGNSQV